MPNHSPDQIVAIVDKMEMGRSDLHSRMDGDMDLYHLQTYGGELDANGEDTLAGYKKFTANDPQTVMNLALHLGSTAKRIIRVHQPRAQNAQREVDNMKELFELGIMTAADERRQKMGLPELQDGMFSQSLFRGRIAQRALLVKEETADAQEVSQSRTYVDITNWDPRNTYWAMGRHGLDWACEKSYKSRQEIIDEYGIDPAVGDPVFSEEDYDKEYAVYDWFDDQDNQIIVENLEQLKARTPHGMGVVPVALGFADLRPRFQASKEEGYDVFYGESLYKADRAIFAEQNFLYSVVSELAKRSITQPLMIMSRDGSLTLPGDPRVSGQEVGLSTANEESILPVPPMETVKEFFPFVGIISGMMQRGSFPAPAFGELSFQLSGFAITQLSQGLLAPLTPHIKAVKNVLKQILDILSDAYSSGNFDQMALSGRRQDPGRSYFSEEISPELVREGGVIEVDIVAQLPKDDTTRVTLAQMLRDGPVPIADDRFVRNMLEFQDPEQMERAVAEQMARRGSPLALAWESYVAASEQEDQDLAAIWWNEFMRIAMLNWLETMQLAQFGGGATGLGGPAGAGGSSNGAAPASRTTPNSSVAPPETRGIQSSPNLQSGPNVPAGTPRPGAQSNEQRLSNIGLVGPRG